jgi:Beta-propeller repeat/Abnormal spindle-like microcephaly-assoc'd, ASPM-SPD-2-Hydin
MKMKVPSMRTSLSFGLALIPALLVASVVSGQNNPSSKHAVTPLPGVAAGVAGDASAEQRAKAAETYGRLPLAFEKNMGQTDAAVDYLSHGNGYELFLTRQEAVLALREPEVAANPALRGRSMAGETANLQADKSAILRMKFEGANENSQISGLQRLPGKIDYFTGNDPSKWHTDVPSYSRVEYRGIYPGVDAVFYGTQRKLEYDFVIAPGADPSEIGMELQGARTLRVEASGALSIGLSSGEVSLEQPVVYQTIGSERRLVAAKYRVSGTDRVTFEVPEYDHSVPLVIDPVLNYSTYLGGSSVGDFAGGIAVDAAGNAYIVGTTYSTTFPTTSNISPASTLGAAFVTKLNAAGTQELYSSYLSGDGGEFGLGVALDTLGNAYICGQTKSTNYPTTTNGFSQTATPIANPSGTAFLSKINPLGSGAGALLYSTLLGGTSGDFASSVAADATGNAFVTGLTLSGPGAAPASFTLQGAFQTTLNSGSGNAFLVRIDTTLSGSASLVYSTYLGGSSSGVALGFGDEGLGVAVDSLKNAYLTGATTSTDFPTTTNAALQAPAPTNIGASGGVFVSKINTAATGSASLAYSTYLYGATQAGDFGNGIALGPANVAYITGQTANLNFYTTTGSYQTATTGTSYIFVSLIDTSKSGASSVTYSAVIGGNPAQDFGTSIKADTLGNAYVTGSGISPQFPVTPGALQSSRPSPTSDAFVLKLTPLSQGTKDLAYASYFAGTTGSTFATGIAIDTLSNAYITGNISGTDLPVFPTGSPSALQTTLTQTDLAATQAAFVSKLTLVPVLAFASPCSITQAPPNSCLLTFTSTVGTPSAVQTITLTNNTNSNIAITLPVVVSGANAADFAAAPASSGGCTATLAAGASCGISVMFTASVSASEAGTLTVSYTYNNGLSATAADSQTVKLAGNGVAPAPTATVTPLTIAFGNQTVGTTSAPQTVTVKNTGTANLTITAAASFSGANASDFAMAAGTTCTNGAVVAVNATCVINITFTPAATGARAATLNIADNAAGSPQTVALTGTGTTLAPTVTLTPAPVTFSGQLVTTTAAPQTVTLKNTGGTTLNITAAPAISGANASDFAVAAGTTCTNGSTVAANATCVINITFTPPAGASGSRSATLTIADNATGSPQTVAITGTAWDFTISAGGATVNAGSSATIAVTVTGLGGFTGPVTLSCTGVGTCAGPANPVTAPGTGNVTVTTQGSLVPPTSNKRPPASMRQIILVVFALMLMFTLPVSRRLRTRVGLAGAAALLVMVAGCSGGLRTPAGTYPVAITGTSGAVSHSITVNVTVN